MIDNSLFRKIFFAAVVTIFVAVALFNGWMSRRLTVIEKSVEPSTAASVASSSQPTHSYSSNVVIDPSHDPLAPRPKAARPRPAQSAPEVEYHIPGGILVQ